jgi:dTDP-4-amino-4,6-dideoxygalactose transaminase
MRTRFLPFALPDTDEAEINEVAEAIRSGWVTTGPKTHQFESEFAAYLGARHAVAVNSCTAAMHLALEAVGLESGDIVLTTPYTFAATAEVVRYFNAVPIFVDIEPDTLNMDPRRLVKTIEDLQHYLGHGCTSRKTVLARALGNGRLQVDVARRLAAIMPVHIAGLPADLESIYAIAAEHNLAVIEDAAHAFPAKYKEQFIGQGPNGTLTMPFPHLVCFSFYATKSITTGEGGMICTDDEVLAERCRLMALHGISKDVWKRYTSDGSWYYEIVAPGYKYNMTDIAASMGLAQLRKAEYMWRRRCQIAQRYNEAFSAIPELETPSDRPDCQHAWHLYILRLNLDRLRIDRDRFIQELKQLNIGTSVHFIPLHMHPYYQETYGYAPDDFPAARKEFGRVVSLPIYSRMSDSDVEEVIYSVSKVVDEWRNY